MPLSERESARNAKKLGAAGMNRNDSAFHRGLTKEERDAVLMLQSLRELPKSRYATQLAITQLPAGRGRKAVFSHIEIYKMVEQIATVLRESGVRPGTVCAMAMPNSVEAVVYFLALQWIGAVAAPINPDLSANDMKVVLKDVAAFTLISPLVNEDDRADDVQYAKIEEVVNSTGIIHWNIFRSINEGVKIEQHGRRAGKGAAWKGGAADFVLDPSQISVHVSSIPSGEINSEGGDRSLIVALTHENLATAAKVFTKTYDLKPEQNVTVTTSPLCSIHTILTISSTLYSGGHIIIPGVGVPFTAETFFDVAKEEKISWISTSADFINDLHNEASTNSSVTNGVSLAFVRCHDGLIDANSRKNAESTLRTVVLQSYGSAESSGIISSLVENELTAGAAGKPVEGATIVALDPETHEILPAGMSGDIAISGAMVTGGYLNNDAANEFSRIIKINDDGEEVVYFLTGNRGLVANDGSLSVAGNSRTMRAVELQRMESLVEEERQAYLDAAAAASAAATVAAAAAALKKDDEDKLEEREIHNAREAEQALEAEKDEKARIAAKNAIEAKDAEEFNARGLAMAAMAAKSGSVDAEAMSKILERLMSIECNQKRMEEELKAKHVAEMAEMKVLLEETQRRNGEGVLMQVNMDEMNAAVTAASMAAQSSSQHTADAAESAKRAALAAEEAASRGHAMTVLDPNSAKVEIYDPNNVQKTVVVSLDEIEEAMKMHPSVGTCRAFGRPDPRYGNEVYCAVLPKKGARLSEPWLKLHAQSVLPAACVPKKFFYREDVTNETERKSLTQDNDLKRISFLSGYSTTKVVKSPAWSPADANKIGA
jgi:acyl-CoA synthetase (AMP-forming)/AMP-acid ligase II